MIIRYPLPEKARRRWHNSTVVRAASGGWEWMGRETFDWWNRKQNPSSSPLVRSPTLVREYTAFANYTEVILCEWVYRAWPGFSERESFEFLCMYLYWKSVLFRFSSVVCSNFFLFKCLYFFLSHFDLNVTWIVSFWLIHIICNMFEYRTKKFP